MNIILNVCELTFTTHLSTQGLKHEITTLFLFTYIGVSKNRGVSPQIIHFDRVFHYFHHPFWGFSPYIRKHPYIAVFFFTQVVPYEKKSDPLFKALFEANARFTVSPSSRNLTSRSAWKTSAPSSYPGSVRFKGRLGVVFFGGENKEDFKKICRFCSGTYEKKHTKKREVGRNLL